MPGDTSPITPTGQSGKPLSPSVSPTRIHRSVGAQYLAPSSPSRSERVTHADTMQIRRAGVALTKQELADLFTAVRKDNVGEVLGVLRRLHDPNVKDPESRETLVHAAATSLAWRVVEALATDPGLASVVDEPVDGRLAIAIAAQKHALFEPVLMSKWHHLMEQVDRYEGMMTSRIGGVAKRFRHALSPGRSAVQEEPPVRLGEPEALNDQLRVLIAEVDDWLTAESKDVIGRTDDGSIKAREFVDLDLSDKGIRNRVKELMEAGGGLQTLRSELARWDNFFGGLAAIARRPLPDPRATPITIHSQASLELDGNPELLIRTLNARRGVDLDAEDPETTAALNRIMKEAVPGGPPLQMTQQQVLLANSYFERLPDQLLQDTGSLIRDVHAALSAADQVHGGREALLRAIDDAVGGADALRKKAKEFRLQDHNTRPKGTDRRPEAVSLRREADKAAKEAEATRRQARRAEFGDTDAPLRKLNEQVDALFVPAFDMMPAEDDTSPEAADRRQRSQELLSQAQAHAEALEVPVSNYRTLQLYIALANRDPRQLEVHPRHLMAACLRLARQYTGRRDDDNKSMNFFGDEVMVAKLKHAERRIMAALDYRLAQHLVGEDEQGRPLPDTLLYRSYPGEKASGSSGRSTASTDHGRKASGSSPSRLGRWISPR